MRKSLFTNIIFLLKNFIIYLMLSRSFLFKPTISTNSFCPSIVYLRESPIFKGDVGVLFWFDSLQTLLDGLTRFMSYLWVTSPLMNSHSTSGVKYILIPPFCKWNQRQSELWNILKLIPLYNKNHKFSKARVDI